MRLGNGREIGFIEANRVAIALCRSGQKTGGWVGRRPAKSGTESSLVWPNNALGMTWILHLELVVFVEVT